MSPGTRIPSYNVCYTKLLRTPRAFWQAIKTNKDGIDIFIAALLHDTGKVAIPSEIPCKP